MLEGPRTPSNWVAGAALGRWLNAIWYDSSLGINDFTYFGLKNLSARLHVEAAQTEFWRQSRLSACSLSSYVLEPTLKVSARK